ncbi:MAG: polysaccharide biosynthesis/export family protein [Bacteroidota bacterium]
MKYKNLVYLNESTDQSYDNYPTRNYEIRPYDILSIQLNSLDQNTSRYFDESFASSTPGGGGGAAIGASLYLNGYIVSEAGVIELPLLGEVQVAGLTTEQIKNKIDKGLEEYLKFASVSVKLVNFRVTILGEVGNPGVQYVYEQKYTLLQAISQAGNVSSFGDARHVKLVRENGDKIQTIHLDITDPEIVSSEYFFLQPNDILYVEPTRARAFRLNIVVPTFIFSAISFGLALVNLLN